MSQDFRLGCLDCKKSIWIGQKDHIYTVPECLEALEQFLFAHQGEDHRLLFGGEYFEGHMLNQFDDVPWR